MAKPLSSVKKRRLLNIKQLKTITIQMFSAISTENFGLKKMVTIGHGELHVTT